MEKYLIVKKPIHNNGLDEFYNFDLPVTVKKVDVELVGSSRFSYNAYYVDSNTKELYSTDDVFDTKQIAFERVTDWIESNDKTVSFCKNVIEEYEKLKRIVMKG